MTNKNINHSFPKEWIAELRKQYLLFISEMEVSQPSIAGHQLFFRELGSYWQRYLVKNDEWALANQQAGMIEKGEYFESLLWPTYISILEHVQLNLDFYKNLKFIDNGSGTGLFAVFLKKLGIDCYNQDDFSQTARKPMSFSDYNPMGYEIHSVSQEIPKDASVILSSGIWVDNPSYLELEDVKIMMVDSRWGYANAHGKRNKCVVPEIASKYNLDKVHSSTSCDFYVKKGESGSRLIW